MGQTKTKGMFFMKGVVFSFKKSALKKSRRNITVSDIRYFLKRYGIKVVFVILLLFGLAGGSVYAQNADATMLDSLDFLFTTNLEARLSQNAAGTFCACFASDFIFLFAILLLGFAPWGILFMPFAVLFKGFGTGLTAGYLFLSNSVKGIGFYLLVLLPGTFLFCTSLALFSSSAFYFSKHMFLQTISKTLPKHPARQRTMEFCSRFMSALIMTFCAALLDTILWTLFAGAFNF